MNPTGLTTTRNGVIDAAKCILIFAIYVFHYGTAAGGLYDFFATFHVPAFFMVSGFWALNRPDRSVWQFVTTAVKRYLLLWLLWVVTYTAYFSLLHQYSLEMIWDIFLRYFLAVRSSGIAGMWFVPAFFLVTLIYFCLAKGVAKLLPRSTIAQAAVLCGLSLVGYVWFDFFLPHPDGMWFSFDQVPVHLFYYALGGLLYRGWQGLPTPRVKRAVAIGGILPVVGYCVMVYCHLDDRLWQFTWEMGNHCLTVIPITLAAVAGLLLSLLVARVIQCRLTVRIGQATLGLCLCELLIKHILLNLLPMMGITLHITPILAVVLALVTLAIGTFAVVPLMNRCVDGILGLFGCGKKKKS